MNSDVVIAGIGQIPVGEHYELSLRQMGVRALRAAIKDSGGMKPQALYIGNMLSSMVSHQANLGALFTDYANLGGIESYTTEASGASGAAALRLGYLAILSGYVDTVAVLGVEKWTDMAHSESETAAALGLDFDYEFMQGMSETGQAGLLMQRYLYEHNLPADALGGFAVQAHANGVNNPNAFFRKAISLETYSKSGMTNPPLNLFDAAPYADGAAAVILTRRDLLPKDHPQPVVRMLGSAIATDTLALHDRKDPLAFFAAKEAVQNACAQAGIMPIYTDVLELDDSYSIYAALTLEACGYADPGEAPALARDGGLAPTAIRPAMTMGGCKARGNAIGAKGVYQAIEAAMQLRGACGPNQVADARLAVTLALGGPASTAVAHVYDRISNE
ncbi:MAG: acetyl-CoA acetyltransferase [Chloroflexi bacterium HGW-Chloroflexi-5]|jgi:acetyl-CoA C-acetyltransferase|nr:MAG: acetyl-CoA acetyltransferase [Chloroflexi bacterium HGW-Chloroflexi-5]